MIALHMLLDDAHRDGLFNDPHLSEHLVELEDAVTAYEQASQEES